MPGICKLLPLFVKKSLKFIEIAKNYDIIHKTKQNLCYGYNMAEGEI